MPARSLLTHDHWSHSLKIGLKNPVCNNSSFGLIRWKRLCIWHLMASTFISNGVIVPFIQQESLSIERKSSTSEQEITQHTSHTSQKWLPAFTQQGLYVQNMVLLYTIVPSKSSGVQLLHNKIFLIILGSLCQNSLRMNNQRWERKKTGWLYELRALYDKNKCFN